MSADTLYLFVGAGIKKDIDSIRAFPEIYDQKRIGKFLASYQRSLQATNQHQMSFEGALQIEYGRNFASGLLIVKEHIQVDDVGRANSPVEGINTIVNTSSSSQDLMRQIKAFTYCRQKFVPIEMQTQLDERFSLHNSSDA